MVSTCFRLQKEHMYGQKVPSSPCFTVSVSLCQYVSG